MLGENRAIVQLGLERLRAAPRPGLAALLSVARLAAGGRRPGEARVLRRAAPERGRQGGGGVRRGAPAPGRGRDRGRASSATILETANATRRDLLKTAIAEARTSPDAVDDAAATIVHGPWPVGIVGLVASRLVDERRRPAIVGADLGPIIRASCRSDGSLHLADALAACEDLLIRHGGHAGAAGLRDRDRALAGVPGALPGARGRVRAAGSGPEPRDRPRAPRPRRRLRAPPRPAPARAVRDRQPGAARRRPRA